LCIIFVKNGSKGDRLLFRFPFKDDHTSKIRSESKVRDIAAEAVAVPKCRKISDILLSPPTLTLDSFNELTSSLLSPGQSSGSRTGSGSSSGRSRKTSRTSPGGGGRFVPRSPYLLDKSAANEVFADSNMGQQELVGRKKFSPGGNEMLNELSDKDLSNLLAVSADLSERKFELKLNYVRFVGHPTLMHQPKDIRPINPL